MRWSRENLAAFEEEVDRGGDIGGAADRSRGSGRPPDAESSGGSGSSARRRRARPAREPATSRWRGPHGADRRRRGGCRRGRPRWRTTAPARQSPLRPVTHLVAERGQASRVAAGMRRSISSTPGASGCGQKESGKERVASRGALRWPACSGIRTRHVRKTCSIACCCTSPPGRAERHEELAGLEGHGRRRRKTRALAGRHLARVPRREPAPARPRGETTQTHARTTGDPRRDRWAVDEKPCPARPPRTRRSVEGALIPLGPDGVRRRRFRTAASPYGIAGGRQRGPARSSWISARRAFAYTLEREAVRRHLPRACGRP